MVYKVARELDGVTIELETGRLAKQANGSIFLSVGDTRILCIATASTSEREDVDFLPLMCDYIERTYSAGKIPGGYFKREGRPTETEVLNSRLIDRPHRPLFPKGWTRESQLVAQVLSYDKDTDPGVAAITGCSAALTISDIPFDGPIAAVRVARVDGELTTQPTLEQRQAPELDIIVVSSRRGIVMVEGLADFQDETVVIDALMLGYEKAQPLIEMQLELREKAGKPKVEFVPKQLDQDLLEKFRAKAGSKVREALDINDKLERHAALRDLFNGIVAEMGDEGKERFKELKSCVEVLEKEAMRKMILEEKRRIAGRAFDEVRDITCEVGVLPRTHGSALFTRGETQALIIVTLGTSKDEQRIDALTGEYFKSFMLHYNFPPYSVGEVKFLRGPSRRDIGHGNLASRGIMPSLPGEEFPYTIRVVSEVTESNGSSSMATACGTSLALMEAGVPVTGPVAGIAMGLVEGEDGEVAILTDILGDEDHHGDMDFKVIGNREGVSAIQMDIKIKKVDRDLLTRALDQAKKARLHILDVMGKTISEPRAELSDHAPRITTMMISTDRIKDLIGPGGKHIRGICEATGAIIDVDDTGTVQVAGFDGDSTAQAIKMIEELTAEAEVGKTYLGTVVKIMDFGAFVRILPNTDGLCHISELADHRVKRVEDVVQEGDEVMVKVINVDRRSGKIKLSRREAMGKKTAE